MVDDATQTQYNRLHRAVIPQVRVEPFVEVSVRSAVEYRRAQTRFHDRGQVAWEQYQRTGSSVPADTVLAKLQARLNAKRKQLGK